MKANTDKPGFIKDSESNVVINTNLKDLERAKKARKRILEEIKRNEDLGSRVEKLETIIEQLLIERNKDG